MGKNRYYQYYVEGADEEKLINVLKSDLAVICSGKIEKFNVVQEELTHLRLMQLKKDTIVILVFDTDTGNPNILQKNIKILQKCCQVSKIICVPQVENLEQELLRSCDIRRIRELTGSRSDKDYKHALIMEKNLAVKLTEKSFDLSKFWVMTPSGAFSGIPNDSREIKLK